MNAGVVVASLLLVLQGVTPASGSIWDDLGITNQPSTTITWEQN